MTFRTRSTFLASHDLEPVLAGAPRSVRITRSIKLAILPHCACDHEGRPLMLR